MLDLKRLITDMGNEKKIVCEHYEKEMTTKAVIHTKCALSSQEKQ